MNGEWNRLGRTHELPEEEQAMEEEIDVVTAKCMPLSTATACLVEEEEEMAKANSKPKQADG